MAARSTRSTPRFAKTALSGEGVEGEGPTFACPSFPCLRVPSRAWKIFAARDEVGRYGSSNQPWRSCPRRGKRGKGLPQSKTLRVSGGFTNRAQRLGVLQPSGAYSPADVVGESLGANVKPKSSPGRD